MKTDNENRKLFSEANNLMSSIRANLHKLAVNEVNDANPAKYEAQNQLSDQQKDKATQSQTRKG